MTVPKDRVMSSETWLKIHQGHKITEEHQDFDLSDGWVKRLYLRCCLTCNKQHLYKMDTVKLDGSSESQSPSS